MSGWRQKSKLPNADRTDIKADELALEKYIRRLSEVGEELGKIGRILERSADRVNPNLAEEQLTHQILDELNSIRIPGFCAYKLAEEGLILLNLISVKIILLRQAYEKAGNRPQIEKMRRLREHIETLHEPLMHTTLQEMRPYSTMDPKKIMESIATGARHQGT